MIMADLGLKESIPNLLKKTVQNAVFFNKMGYSCQACLHFLILQHGSTSDPSDP
ncbi:hypothetical protein AGMMS49950_06320 [Endomicrobiia bacterium]|nr:hypothetical protein AGMMS49531_07040 [Endomicrobiia bacterium]GHT70778.1 hypothetical protein AGMMS49950_06320 [Endomicrobiia bacterium]